MPLSRGYEVTTVHCPVQMAWPSARESPCPQQSQSLDAQIEVRTQKFQPIPCSVNVIFFKELCVSRKFLADDIKSEENRSGEKILFAARVAYVLSVSPFFLLSFRPMTFQWKDFLVQSWSLILWKNHVWNGVRGNQCMLRFRAPASCREVEYSKETQRSFAPP